MPASEQASSPPPAYINHGNVSATHIEILHIDSEGCLPVLSTPQPASPAQQVADNPVPATHSAKKQDLINLTSSAPVAVSSPTDIANIKSDNLLSKLEQAIQRLESSQENRLIARLEDVLSLQADKNMSAGKRDTRKPIKLKDAVGRRFSFPYDRCETWAVSYSSLLHSTFPPSYLLP